MYTLSGSFGSTSAVCVCEPRHVCTLPTFFGFVMSVMSKMRRPRSRSTTFRDASSPRRSGARPRPVAQGCARQWSAIPCGEDETRIPLQIPRGWSRALIVRASRMLLRGLLGRESEEHPLHASDLRRLVDVDVGGVLERELVLRGAIGVEGVLHHRPGTLVMLDHEGQKFAIELLALRLVELMHLRVGEHSRHQHLLFLSVHRHLHR